MLLTHGSPNNAQILFLSRHLLREHVYGISVNQNVLPREKNNTYDCNALEMTGDDDHETEFAVGV